MKTYEESPEYIDGLIYLKIFGTRVNAYGDIDSLEVAEKEQHTGKLFDYSLSPDEWNAAGNVARIVDGKIILGLPHDFILEQQAEIIRNERYLRLRECDKISPMRWIHMSEEEKKAWDEYRLALLDIPQQKDFPWDGDLDSVPWPQKPDY